MTAISSQVEISPRRLACWSPLEVRNRKLSPRSSRSIRCVRRRPSPAIQSRIEKTRPLSARTSRAPMLAVSIARTESAVFGFFRSTMDCATVPSIASASSERSVFSRCSTSTRFFLSPCRHSTPAPLENSCRAAVTQNGSTVSFCCGMSAAAMVSKSLGDLASNNGDHLGARASSGFSSTSLSGSKNAWV